MKRGASGLNLLAGIDKPLGISSHDVVARVRRIVGEKRVGHAGTLDPLADGVMVLGIGQATRLMSYVTADEKSYRVRISFGRETETDDAQGATRCVAPVPSDVMDEAWARAGVERLLAMRSQVPPAYSAIQVDGVRSYAAARRGEEVVLASRDVEVRAAVLNGVGISDEEPWWDVSLTVSKGTHVRALARDLGRELGSACYVSALKRTASGSVSLADCVTLEELAEADGIERARLDPAAVLGCPQVRISAAEIADVSCGKRLSVARTDGGSAGALPENALVALVGADRLYAVARRLGGALAPQAVFVDGIDGVAQCDPS